LTSSESEFADDVCFRPSGTSDGGALYAGIDFRLDEQALAKSLSGSPRSRIRDLLRVAMAIYIADRLSRRDRKSGVRGPYRQLSVSVQVSEPDFWSAEPILGLIGWIAEFLSDDTWELRFVPLPGSGSGTRQRSLDFAGSSPLICLYSGGLDSAAGLAGRLREHKGQVVVVTANHQAGQSRRVAEQLDTLKVRYAADLYPTCVRTTLVNAPRMSSQELSQRCRSFLFCALGGVVASMVGASTVELYENGVGAVNLPPMTGMLLGGRMSKSSHPAFVRAMGDLVSRVAERPIAFELPFATRTKAEMVRALQEDGLAKLANATVSCVHFPLRVKGSRKQCGVCPACIGRRHAMAIACVEESPAQYQYDFLGGREMLRAIPDGELGFLRAMLMQVEHLRELRKGGTIPQRILRHLVGTGVVQPGESCEPWGALLARYRDEWLTLIAEAQARGLGWARLVQLSTTVA